MEIIALSEDVRNSLFCFKASMPISPAHSDVRPPTTYAISNRKNFLIASNITLNAAQNFDPTSPYIARAIDVECGARHMADLV